jgi:hypothetical protein
VASTDWAEQELGHAALGDVRRTRRAVQVLAALGAQPGAAVSDAVGGDATAAKGAYRLFANPAIVPADLRTAHQQTTAARVRSEPVVLVLHDTTELDWTAHPATTGLGPLTAPSHQGLHVHSALAVTPDGVPLGLLAQQGWARDPADAGSCHARRARPFDVKESHKWGAGIAAAAAMVGGATRLIHIGDQESDVYDVFLFGLRHGHEFLLRTGQLRRTDQPGQLNREVLAAQPVAATRTIVVGRAPHRPEREARLALRWTTLTLRPPRSRDAEHLPPITVTAIAVQEADPPVGEPPIDWLLVTTLPTRTVEAAWERVGWYALRWRIERYHYVLKSGCRLEASQLQTGERLERLLALAAVVAWRVLYLTYAARTTPATPATWLRPLETRLLWAAIGQDPGTAPATATTREAVRALAKLGGFLGRRGDGEPGVKVL